MQNERGGLDHRRRGPARGIELIERIEDEKLDAGDRIDLFARHALPDRLHDAVGPDVTVVIRLFDEIAALVEERVVAAPGIHADAVGPAVRASIEPGLDLAPETPDVPVQRAVLADGGVRKAAQLVERQHAGAQAAAHHATAFRSEIDGEEMSTHTVQDPMSARHRPRGRDSIRLSLPPAKKFCALDCLTIRNAAGAPNRRPLQRLGYRDAQKTSLNSDASSSPSRLPYVTVCRRIRCALRNMLDPACVSWRRRVIHAKSLKIWQLSPLRLFVTPEKSRFCRMFI